MGRVIALLKQDVHDDYQAVVEWQGELRKAVEELILQQLQPAFNRVLAAMPHDTLRGKQTLCRFANSELRSLAYSVRCPRTGQPAMLHAHRGNNHAVGCFQVELIGSGFDRRRTKYSSKLFPIELMVSPPRSEPLANYWATKVSNQSTDKHKSM